MTRYTVRLGEGESRVHPRKLMRVLQIKCTHYWPLEPGNAFTFDGMRVTLVNEEKTFENRLVERTLHLLDLDTVRTFFFLTNLLFCSSSQVVRIHAGLSCVVRGTGGPKGGQALPVPGLARSRPS